MRCILSGVEIRRYLSFRTLVAKVIGLTAAFVAGFSIGKEGPIIHISSIICRQLTRIPFFRHIHQNDATFLEVLSAACAGGVTLAFGSPIGGAIFSIEATSSFYLTSNLWKGLFVSACGAVLLTAAGELGSVAMFTPQLHKQAFNYAMPELFAFSLVGLTGGVFGAVLIKLISLAYKLPNISPWFSTRRGKLFRTLTIATACSASTYGFYNYSMAAGPETYRLNTTDYYLDYLFNKETASAEWGLLISMFFVKVILTIFSFACTGIPAGIYGACFLVGACYGRIFGEVAKLIFPGAHPGAYAVIGAASVTSSISHTVSTVIIVIELTKEINLLLPSLIAVLISVAVCKLLSDSIFDVVIKQRELPLMPSFDLYASYHQTAADVMRTNYEVLHFEDTYGKLATALQNSTQTMFPLVDENHIFLGAVRRSIIERVLSDNSIPFGATTPNHSINGIITSIFTPDPLVENISKNSSDGEDTESSEKEKPASQSIELEAIAEDRSESDIQTSGLLRALGEPIGIYKEQTPDASTAADTKADRVNVGDQVPYVFLSRHTGSTSGNVIEVDSTVMQIDANSSIFKAHFLFTMLGLGNLFVTSRGKLCGVITRTSLIRSISAMAQRQS